jgi:hypothetical protein
MDGNTKTCVVASQASNSCTNSGGHWDKKAITCTCPKGLTFNPATLACECPQAAWYKGDPKDYPYSSYLYTPVTFPGMPPLPAQCVDTLINTFYQNHDLHICAPGSGTTVNAQGQCCKNGNCTTPMAASQQCKKIGGNWYQDGLSGKFYCNCSYGPCEMWY